MSVDDPLGVYFDGRERVVGLWGLALADTPTASGSSAETLYACCAWDALFLPELIGKPAFVESRCPTTGETVTRGVAPRGVGDVT